MMQNGQSQVHCFNYHHFQKLKQKNQQFNTIKYLHFNYYDCKKQQLTHRKFAKFNKNKIKALRQPISFCMLPKQIPYENTKIRKLNLQNDNPYISNTQDSQTNLPQQQEIGKKKKKMISQKIILNTKKQSFINKNYNLALIRSTCLILSQSRDSIKRSLKISSYKSILANQTLQCLNKPNFDRKNMQHDSDNTQQSLYGHKDIQNMQSQPQFLNLSFEN